MIGITADSNIWVSAFNFGGIPRRLIDMADVGLIRIDISDDIIDEVLRVLRLKFEWPEESLAEAKTQMNEIGHLVTPKRKVDAVTEDPTDNRILECAVAGASDYLVTGDNHLLKLRQFAGTKILKAADFLNVQMPPSRGR